MPINLGTIPTNAAQDAKLAKMLARINAQREAETPPKPPFATFADYARDVLIDAVKSYVKQQDDEDGTSLRTAYDAATPAQQASARTALGLP